MHVPSDALAAPRLYLSSAQAGWTDLVAEAFHEPHELESWVVPAQAYVSLIVFAGGAMHLEQRHADGPWIARVVGPEDLILRPAMDRGYEVRWESHSPVPIRTLHLCVSMDLLARTAEAADYDPARLTLVEHVGFQDPVLAQIGLALWRELEHPASAGRLYAQTAAQLLAVHLLRYYASAAGPLQLRTPVPGLTRHQLAQVTDLILTHLREPLSLDDLAEVAGFSPYHFARLFRQTVGESPHQYVLRQRLAQARRLLAEPLPLARIALESGFANQSHFTRTFKRRFGVTPHAYRKACSISAHLGNDQQE